MGTVPPGKTAPHLKLVPDPPIAVAREALPGWAVDLISKGLPPRDLRMKDGGRRRIVWSLGRTADSAIQRGWTFERWHALLLGDVRPSQLAYQYRLMRSGRPATARELDSALRRIWKNSEQWVAEHPPEFSERQILAHLEDVRVAVQGSGLGVGDRKVMLAILFIGEVNTTLTPAAPRRTIVAALGVGDRAVRNGLERLIKGGWLLVVTKGKSGKPVKGEKGVAAIYRPVVPRVRVSPEPRN